MLTAIEARKIGIRACIEKIGYDFCMANEGNSVTAYGEEDGRVFCFVGINDKPTENRNPDVLILSSLKGFPYYASCYVYMDDGRIEYLDFVAFSG